MTASAKIVAWLLLAIQTWGASPVARTDQDRVNEVRAEVATDIASVFYDLAEPPLYPRDPYGRARGAILVTSIAALESRFIERIIRGRCKHLECDGGAAVGLLQIHAGPFGIRLVGGGAAQCGRTTDAACFLAVDLARDTRLQVRVGLHLLRTLGLGGFTGEGVEGPAALARRTQAEDWMALHPPPVDDAAVMQLPTER